MKIDRRWSTSFIGVWIKRKIYKKKRSISIGQLYRFRGVTLFIDTSFPRMNSNLLELNIEQQYNIELNINVLI